jgi:TonB family protein
MSSHWKSKLIGSVLLFQLATAVGGAKPSFSSSATSPLTGAEAGLRRSPVHVAEFAPLSSPVNLAACAQTRLPEALATPDPLLQLNESLVRVSFIVNAAGRVESPFVLESSGTADDQIILNAVRYWRFRPALCNGVPTGMEARVRFSDESAARNHPQQ